MGVECGLAQGAAFENDQQAIAIVLVSRAQAGDFDAFDVLLRSRIERLLRVAIVIVGNDADARDATQTACVQASRELPRLRDPNRFDAWLGRILTNACRTSLRVRRRRTVREIQLDVLDGPGQRAVLDPSTGPADRLGDQDSLRRAFERLNPEARAILVLYHLEERSVAEIAAFLGIARTAVKWRLVVARRAPLRRALELENQGGANRSARDNEEKHGFPLAGLMPRIPPNGDVMSDSRRLTPSAPRATLVVLILGLGLGACAKAAGSATSPAVASSAGALGSGVSSDAVRTSTGPAQAPAAAAPSASASASSRSLQSHPMSRCTFRRARCRPASPGATVPPAPDRAATLPIATKITEASHMAPTANVVASGRSCPVPTAVMHVTTARRC